MLILPELPPVVTEPPREKNAVGGGGGSKNVLLTFGTDMRTIN
jgi:hypothetical protein